MSIPTTLAAQRLTLCPFEPDDWRAMHEHYADAECTRHAFGRARTEGGRWRAVAIKLALAVGATLERPMPYRGNPFNIHRHPRV